MKEWAVKAKVAASIKAHTAYASLSNVGISFAAWETAYKVPVGAVGGDANVGNPPVDAMGDWIAVDDDGTIAHVCDCFGKETVGLNEVGLNEVEEVR